MIATLMISLLIVVIGGVVWASSSFQQLEEVHKERKNITIQAQYQ